MRTVVTGVEPAAHPAGRVAIACDIHITCCVRGYGIPIVVVFPTQVGAPNMAAGTGEFDYKAIEETVETGVEPAAHPVGVGETCDIHTACCIRGDARPIVIVCPAQVRAPNMAACTGEFDYKAVVGTVVTGVESAAHPAGRVGRACDIHTACCIRGDVIPIVIVCPAQVGAPGQVRVNYKSMIRVNITG